MQRLGRVEYLIGVDGGGSGTRAVVQPVGGTPLAVGRAGPSALGQGIPQAWRHIEEAIREAFDCVGLRVPSWSRCALAAGLSGVSHEPWREAFVQADPGFAGLVAESDSYTMLLGAHGGEPGAIVIAGTGSIAEALLPGGTRRTAGGWGFPVGDEGSGAWLGLQAVRHAQAALDGREAAGALAERVWQHCGEERERLQAWCAQAGQFAYAQLARAVFEAEPRDPVAAQCLLRAVEAIETLALAVDPRGHLPLAISGSIGERLAARLRPAIQRRLVTPQAGPAVGALALLAHLNEKESAEAL